MAKSSIIRYFALAFVAIGTMAGIGYFVISSSLSTRASTDNVEITMIPTSETLSINESKTIRIQLRSLTAGKPISKFDIRLKASDSAGFEISSISAPIEFPAATPAAFTETTKSVSGATAHLAYDRSASAGTMPSLISFDVVIKGLSNASEIFELDTITSHFYAADQSEFGYGKTDSLSLTVGAGGSKVVSDPAPPVLNPGVCSTAVVGCPSGFTSSTVNYCPAAATSACVYQEVSGSITAVQGTVYTITKPSGGVFLIDTSEKLITLVGVGTVGDQVKMIVSTDCSRTVVDVTPETTMTCTKEEYTGTVTGSPLITALAGNFGFTVTKDTGGTADITGNTRMRKDIIISNPVLNDKIKYIVSGSCQKVIINTSIPSKISNICCPVQSCDPVAKNKITVCAAAGTGCDAVGPVGIQTAIDTVATGGTVSVQSGTYPLTTGLLISNKSLNLVGSGSGSAILNTSALTASPGIQVQGSGTSTISGFDIVGRRPPASGIGGNTDGIQVKDTAVVTIHDVISEHNQNAGFSAIGASHMTLDNVTSRNNYWGVYLGENSVNTVKNSFISNNVGDEGINARDASINTISYTVIDNNTNNGFASHNTSQSTLQNDTVVANNVGVRLWDTSKVTLKNTLVALNKYSGHASGVACSQASQLVSASYNDVFGNSNANYGKAAATDTCNVTDQTGQNNNVSVDPLFFDLTNYNYHITAASPLSHGGDPVIKNADGSRSDIGALAVLSAGSTGTGGGTGTGTGGGTGTGTGGGTGTGTGGGTGTGTGTGGTGGTATGTVVLNLKVKFQGISKLPAAPYNTQPVKVAIGGGSLTAPTAFITVTMTSDASGIWSGSAAFTAPAGTNYYLLVKGPKHLQKKICVTQPTETTMGAYSCKGPAITLAAGTNALNFSGISLLAGDLPLDNGAQNGVVDSSDAVFIRSNLSKRDAALLAIGDLNLDGVIDTQDYSILTNTLSIRNDEE